MLRERLNQSIGRNTAQRSPLLSMRREINQAVEAFVRQYSPEIMAAVINTLNQQKFKDTVTPKKNKDYFDGAAGPKGDTPSIAEVVKALKPHIPAPISGPKGDRGDDAEPDTVAAVVLAKLPKVEELKPDAIVDKVNTAKAKVALASVAGLPEELKALKRAARENKGGGTQKGGGMGNWLHQRFATSAATTTVTTNYRAAANGMAHLLRYNGQVQDYGTDYAIGADHKTYTFTFTLDDNSVVSVAYVRT